MMKSEQTKCGNQGRVLSGQIKSSCDPQAPPCSLPEQPSELPLRATVVGDLSLNSLQEVCSTPWHYAVPPLSSTAPDFALYCTVTVDWCRLFRGLKPPAAAARLVNGSTQPGSPESTGGKISGELLMCPAACSIHRGSHRQKAARTHETEQKIETVFQGDPFIRLLGLLHLEGNGPTKCTLNQQIKPELWPAGLQGANFAALI